MIIYFLSMKALMQKNVPIKIVLNMYISLTATMFRYITVNKTCVYLLFVTERKNIELEQVQRKRNRSKSRITLQYFLS